MTLDYRYGHIKCRNCPSEGYGLIDGECYKRQLCLECLIEELEEEEK